MAEDLSCLHKFCIKNVSLFLNVKTSDKLCQTLELSDEQQDDPCFIYPLVSILISTQHRKNYLQW